jgi:hypothetical protein
MARLLSHCCNKEAIVLARYRLATSWTIRALNPGGGEIFRARPYRNVALTTDIPLLAPSLFVIRSIPLPSFCAFMARYRVAVTLTVIVLAFVAVYISIARTSEYVLMAFCRYQ